MNIEIRLAGLPVRVGLRYAENARHFESFITARDCPDRDVWVPDGEAERFPLVSPSGVLDAPTERYLLIGHVTRFLLPQGAAIFHAAAFRWRGKAWLFAASSGVGKTTQLRHWLRLWGDEVEIINGDKPAVAAAPDGAVRVFPSPWNGKENYFGTAEGPLGGIILLRQEEHDAIRRLAPAEAAAPILQRFLMNGETEEELHAACRMTEAILRSAPVWLLENRGGEDAARLTRDTLTEFEEHSDD